MTLLQKGTPFAGQHSSKMIATFTIVITASNPWLENHLRLHDILFYCRFLEIRAGALSHPDTHTQSMFVLHLSGGRDGHERMRASYRCMRMANGNPSAASALPPVCLHSMNISKFFLFQITEDMIIRLLACPTSAPFPCDVVILKERRKMSRPRRG